MTYANLSWNRTFDNNKKYVWVTESGSNVCDVCKSLNGKIFSGNEIPQKPHPNCRCAIMEEPVYDNYREKLKEIKSTVENVVCAEVEKEISRRNDSTAPVIEKIIAKNRFNIRKEIEKNVIFKVENAVLEKAATSDLTNLNKLITETAKIFVPEETEKVLTLEKKKYEKEEKKKEVFGQIMTEREKAQAEKVESIVKNCEATVKKIVAEEVNKEISRKNHTKDLTALRIAARLRNDEKQEIGQSVIYKVENAIREEAEKSETPDVKTLQKLIRETAKQAAREEVERTFERELKKYQRSEKEKRIKKGVEEAIKKEVHGQVLTKLEKADDERIDTIVKNCKFTVEKAVVNELKIEQAAFKKIKDPGFAKIIEKDSDNIKKEVARNAIFEIELVIREETKKSKNLDVRTLQKLIDKTAEKAVIEEIQNILEREENKYIAAEKARKREEETREQTAKDVENAIKKAIYEKEVTNRKKAKDESIRLAIEKQKEAIHINKKVASEGIVEFLKCYKNHPFDLIKAKSRAFRNELKNLETSCPPEVVGKNIPLAYEMGYAGENIYKAPSARTLLFIGMDIINVTDPDYLTNVKVYNQIGDLKQPKLKKTIESLIKEDNKFYKKYDMPAIENCKTYWFNENHELSKKIANSQAVKNLVRKESNINPSDERPAFIEFKNGIDTDLYYAIHNARVTRFKIDTQNKIMRIRVEDLYDFDPSLTDYLNRIGTELQRNGNLKPYYLIIDLKVPYTYIQNRKLYITNEL